MSQGKADSEGDETYAEISPRFDFEAIDPMLYAVLHGRPRKGFVVVLPGGATVHIDADIADLEGDLVVFKNKHGVVASFFRSNIAGVINPMTPEGIKAANEALQSTREMAEKNLQEHRDKFVLVPQGKADAARTAKIREEDLPIIPVTDIPDMSQMEAHAADTDKKMTPDEYRRWLNSRIATDRKAGGDPRPDHTR